MNIIYPNSVHPVAPRMCKTVALVLALLTLEPLTSGQVDSIRIPETGGCVIVELVLERIENVLKAIADAPVVGVSMVASTKSLLRRITAVESDYGRADHTYRDDFHGGIWQVDEADFDHTLTGRIVTVGLDHISVHFAIAKIKGVEIDWTSIQDPPKWEDLRKPLYSGLAAMLKLFLSGEQIPDTDNVTGQADFWIRYYHTNAGGPILTRENFTAAANTGCAVPCQSYPDIVFVIDSSGSIGSSHFQQALNFTADLVSEFRIGPDFTHIGVITYSGYVITSEQIELSRFYEASELSAAIRNI